MAIASRVLLLAAALITEAFSQTAVGKRGRLRVSGNRVQNQHGQNVQLRGMSIFWSQWGPGSKYYNRNMVKHLVDDWQVTLVRAALGVEPDGYLSNPAREKAKVVDVVEAAIEFGIYVLIDWHDHYAEQHIGQAKAFFGEMARTYGNSPNVIFETFNEPINQDWGSVIKPYHEQLVPEIRRYSDNLIVLGTKTYSQRVDEASWNKVPGENLAYTLHFYANTHRGDLRAKATTAMNNGIALFVTEWGTCSADGNGVLDLGETQVWLNFLKENSISDANWAIADKNEACAALKPGSNANGGWSASDLTTSGAWVRNSIRAFSAETSTCSKVGTNPYYPDLGGCCSGLKSCKEARSTSDSVYCPEGSAGHGTTCWSQIDKCRNSCDSTSKKCAAWDRLAGRYTCGARIRWLKANRGMNDVQAKDQVAGEFPTECGACRGTPTSPGPVCKNNHRYCGYWSQRGFCRGIYQAYMQKTCSRACGYCPTGFSMYVVHSNETETSPLDPDSDSLWDGLESSTTSETPPADPSSTSSSTSSEDAKAVGAIAACFERVPSALLPLMLIVAICRLD